MDFSIIEEMDSHCLTLCEVIKQLRQQNERLRMMIQKLFDQHLKATVESDTESIICDSDITSDSDWVPSDSDIESEGGYEEITNMYSDISDAENDEDQTMPVVSDANGPVVSVANSHQEVTRKRKFDGKYATIPLKRCRLGASQGRSEVSYCFDRKNFLKDVH